MNLQPDVFVYFIFLLSTFINCCATFGWYDGYKFKLFSRPTSSSEEETEYKPILSLWSNYNFLRQRRSSTDHDILKNDNHFTKNLFTKRFFHYSPFIMKSKGAKSRKTKVKTSHRKQEKTFERPFTAFGLYINTFKPKQINPIQAETVPETISEDENLLQGQIIHGLSDEVSSLIPNLSENSGTIRPQDSEKESLPMQNEGESEDLNDLNPSLNDFENIPLLSTDTLSSIGKSSQETAKKLDISEDFLEPIHQRAFMKGSSEEGEGQIKFSDQEGFFDENEMRSRFQTDNHGQGGFIDSLNLPGKNFDGFRVEDDILSQDGGMDQSGFNDMVAAQDIGTSIGQNGFIDQRYLDQHGSFPADPQDFNGFTDGQFGDFSNSAGLDHSDISGGEYFNDGSDFEGFFDTDQSGCDGIQTRRCVLDTECSCLGLYFCIEGRCTARTAIQSGGLDDGVWLEDPVDFR